jgi:hypothetical protein
MRFRKLRVAWSVAWGVLAVLLCVLWVRSYTWTDIITYKRLTSSKGWVYANQGFNCPDGMGEEFSYPSGYWKMRFNGVRVVPIGPRGIAIPYLLLVALTLLAAGTPWIRHFKWHFSLRTLLIATTLVAMVLGIIVWMSQR